MKTYPFIIEKGIEFIELKKNPECNYDEYKEFIEMLKREIEEKLFCIKPYGE